MIGPDIGLIEADFKADARIRSTKLVVDGEGAYSCGWFARPTGTTLPPRQLTSRLLVWRRPAAANARIESRLLRLRPLPPGELTPQIGR